MSGVPSQPPSELSPAARISILCVQLLHTYTGRGPTKAWTSIDGDLICIVLRDTLSKGERRLIADSRAQLVSEMRKAYQTTMGDELVAGVEEISGRKVIAFLSDNHFNPDIAVETFVLEPLADPAGDLKTSADPTTEDRNRARLETVSFEDAPREFARGTVHRRRRSRNG